MTRLAVWSDPAIAISRSSDLDSFFLEEDGGHAGLGTLDTMDSPIPNETRSCPVLPRSPVISYVMSRITPMLKLTRHASWNIRGIDRLRARIYHSMRCGCHVYIRAGKRIHHSVSGISPSRSPSVPGSIVTITRVAEMASRTRREIRPELQDCLSISFPRLATEGQRSIYKWNEAIPKFLRFLRSMATCSS
jgi:hypothetical protein